MNKPFLRADLPEVSPLPRPPGWIEILAVILISLFAMTYRIGDLRMYPDEPNTTQTSIAFEAYFSLDWGNPVFDGYLATTAMPMMRYLAGLGRWVHGDAPPAHMKQWDSFRGAAWNRRAGITPPPRLLEASRLPFGVLAAGSATILFLMTMLMMGRISAWTFLTLFLTSPYFHETLRKIMGESPVMFFSVAAMLVMVVVVHWMPEIFGNEIRFYGLCAAAGALIGLAVCSKLNALTAVPGALLCLMLPVLFNRLGVRSSWRTILWATLVLTLMSGVTLLLTNPFIAKNPVQNFRAMVDHRRSKLQTQPRVFRRDALGSKAQKKQFLMRSLDVYGSFPEKKAVNVLLSMVGFLLLGRSAWIYLRGNGGSPASVVFLVFGGCLAAPMLSTPLAWSRYLMFPVMVIHVAVAVAIGFLVEWALRILGLDRYLAKKQPPPASVPA